MKELFSLFCFSPKEEKRTKKKKFFRSKIVLKLRGKYRIHITYEIPTLKSLLTHKEKTKETQENAKRGSMLFN